MHLLHVKNGNVITHRVPVQFVGNRSAPVSAHQPASWTTVFGRTVAAAFAFVRSLAHERRAPIDTTDELAVAAATWEASSRSRAVLARQIETAQVRSQAGLPGMANAALARPAMFAPGTLFSHSRSSPYRG